MSQKRPRGWTLIEMMIVVAIIAIVSAIAIPVYNNYVSTAQGVAVRSNMDPLRIQLEDFFLDNNTYKAGGAATLTWTAGSGANAGMTALGWHPDAVEDLYNYNVAATNNNYTIVVTHASDGSWGRCENRMTKCCSGIGTPPAACP